jgi:hypothetical protein
MAVFEYQNQNIFNMTIFVGELRCHIDTCFWHPNKNVVIEDVLILIFKNSQVIKSQGYYCQAKNPSHFQHDAYMYSLKNKF